MSSVNKKLVVAAIALLLLSAFSYWTSVSRADRFERGQKLLANLNPDEVARIEIRSAGDAVTLVLNGESYVVEEADGYRARNDAVNRLIRDLLDIELEKEIGSSDALAGELGLAALANDAIEIALINRSSEEMVRVRVGNEAEEGAGHFVRRLDGEPSPIYLTTDRVQFQTDQSDLLKREIVDVQAADIRRIEGPDFVLERPGDGGSLELVQPARPAKSSEVSKLSSFLNRLSFAEVFLGDDPEVAELAFAQALRVDLDDDSGYIVSHAKKDDRHFVELTGYLNVDRIEVGQDESEEELKEKAEVLKRSDEINQFNAYHGSWIYELESFDGEKLDLRASDLIDTDTDA